MVALGALELQPFRSARLPVEWSSPQRRANEIYQVCFDTGADHVIDWQNEDIVTRVKELTDGRGADVIYDPVGGDAFDASTHCINFEGRLIVIGFASGRIPEIKGHMILNKNMSVMGFWTNYLFKRPDLVDDYQGRDQPALP